jgi:hypothetical protein
MPVHLNGCRASLCSSTEVIDPKDVASIKNTSDGMGYIVPQMIFVTLEKFIADGEKLGKG